MGELGIERYHVMSPLTLTFLYFFFFGFERSEKPLNEMKLQNLHGV